MLCDIAMSQRASRLSSVCKLYRSISKQGATLLLTHAGVRVLLGDKSPGLLFIITCHCFFAAAQFDVDGVLLRSRPWTSRFGPHNPPNTLILKLPRRG